MKMSILVGLLAAIFSLFGLPHQNTYVDPARRFSFKLPSNESVQDISAVNGAPETLLLQGGANDAQIVVNPWTGDVTVASLETEFPYLEDYLNRGVVITETAFQGTPAIAFDNQIWFSHGGYLYVAEDVPPSILSSWRF